jgi:acyl carrier protein
VNTAEAKRLIFAVLEQVAPEVDPTTIDEARDLTEQLDLDSMDYLNWMIGINEESGVDVPYWEQARFLTIDGAADYLVANAGP